MATLERAVAIAAQAHTGQRDKAGAPYLLHPLRLMMRLANELPLHEDLLIAAVLHDVVEDSAWTLAQLRAEGFAATVLDAVDCLTKRDAESYVEFVARASANPLARQVKRVDIEDNLDVRRLTTLTEKDLARIDKYHRVWRELAGVKQHEQTANSETINEPGRATE